MRCLPSNILELTVMEEVADISGSLLIISLMTFHFLVVLLDLIKKQRHTMVLNKSNLSLLYTCGCLVIVC